MKIGFIGFGNMAKAIAGGINMLNFIPANEICVFDINECATNEAQKQNYIVLDSENSVVQQAEFVFFCVKPQHFSELLLKVKNDITENNKFVSIAAGISMQKMAQQIGNAPIIRAMPNTPLLLAHGTVALCKNNHVSDDDYAFIKKIFEGIGMVQDIPELLFNEIINVSGSTPAYVYLFAKIIADYASEHGIDKQIALTMFCNTMVGSAKMLTQTQYSPEELIQMVASKGGTTQAALDEFAKNGFESCLTKGMDACLKRAKELNS